MSSISAQMFSEFSNEPIGNVVLYYISSAPISDATVTPLCAYVDSSGEVKDLLFYGIIIYDLNLHAYPCEPTHNTCDKYIADLFGKGHQLDSLDIIVHRIKQKLNIADFRWKVILSAPYYKGLSQYNITYYCKKMISIWKKKHFSNLELLGFYFGYLEWIDEEIIPVIQKMAEYLHSNGYKLFWIPSYQNSPDLSWFDYGFDYVVEQPNYAFYLPDTLRFLQVDFHIKKYGISGAEMELHNYASASNGLTLVENANDYFNFAEKLKWQGNPLNVFYFGPLISDFSRIDTLRIIYERIYHFVRGYECIILKPVEDAYVELMKPAAKMGATDRLALGTNSYNNCFRTYLKFDLSRIKTEDSVHWVKLYLKPEKWQCGSSIDDIQLFTISSEVWTEPNITWNNQPYSAIDSILDIPFTNLQGLGWRYWDITQATIKEYHKDKKFSLMLKRHNENNEDKICIFHSREKNSLKAPKLYVGVRRKISY